jgi:hypothetical protein
MRTDLRAASIWSKLSPSYRVRIERRHGLPPIEKALAASRKLDVTLQRFIAETSGELPVSDSGNETDAKAAVAQAIAPKPQASNAALKALPGLLHSVTRALNDEAAELAKRLHKAVGESETHMPRARAHVETIETRIGQVKDFNEQMDSALGDNGPPQT